MSKSQPRVVDVEQVFQSIEAGIPDFKNRLQQMRRESFGLLPVGGKIHVLHQMDSARFEAFKSLFGFRSTSFRMIHASHSLLLPPMPSADEIKVIAQLLDFEKIIDWDHPEIQIGIAGRLTPKRCAVLGAAILLATQEGVIYDQNSFSTSHDEDTGLRIIAYDAGGPREVFPFDTRILGRTDMLGRRDLGDFKLYQQLGTVLVHSEGGGPFGHLADPFEQEFAGILQRHNIEGVLNESWVNPLGDEFQRRSAAGYQHFQMAVRPCVDAWFDCFRKIEETGVEAGIIFEVRDLFGWLRSEISKIQEGMLGSENFENARRALLMGDDF